MKKWLLFKEYFLLTSATIVFLILVIPGTLLYLYGGMLGALGCDMMESAEKTRKKWRRKRLKRFGPRA